MSTKDLTGEKMPFYAWECISLQVANRIQDTYLVIRNEKCMSDFLKLLIYELNAADGSRNSSIAI